MTVGPASDDARVERAAARAERLQTSTVDETLVDIAQGADSVSGGSRPRMVPRTTTARSTGARPRAGAGANGSRVVAGNAT